MVKIKKQRRLNFIMSTEGAPVYVPKSVQSAAEPAPMVVKGEPKHPSINTDIQKSRPSHRKKVGGKQKYINTDIQKSPKKAARGKAGRKPAFPPDTKIIKTSFFFPMSLIKELKYSAFEKKVPLSDYIADELKKKTNKKVDIVSVRKYIRGEKTAQLCLLIPEEIVKSIKRESIDNNVPFTHIMIGKLH